MSNLEDVVYIAIKHGVRDELFKEVTKLKAKDQYMPLDLIYEKALQKLLKNK